ncbi:MAG: DUF2188 domain-containing protein [Anaerolineaceae bacterium]
MATKKPNIWITPHNNGWAVKREGGKRSSILTDTKTEAEKFGRDLGKKEHVEVIIQRKNGTVQKRESYGHDPFPPKDEH